MDMLMDMASLREFLLVILGAVLVFAAQQISERRTLKRKTLSLYIESQAKTFDEFFILLADMSLYIHSKMAELSPNEHYVFALVYEENERQHLQYYHMALDKLILQKSAYLPSEVEKKLTKLSEKLSLIKNIEIHGLSLEEQEGSYIAANSSVDSTRSAIKAYIQKQ